MKIKKYPCKECKSLEKCKSVCPPIRRMVDTSDRSMMDEYKKDMICPYCGNPITKKPLIIPTGSWVTYECTTCSNFISMLREPSI